jgi:predicted PhzF superfamily epimerase YddE/YHI9
MNLGSLFRLSSFTTILNEGNPAGVWIGDILPDPETMQRIAAEVGCSEIAFVAPVSGSDRIVSYYSPEVEVSFCGHAKQCLAELNYDFETLKALMLRDSLTTLQLIWRESATVFHSRNPFPVGGIVEDPATGSAAAALRGYLRASKLVTIFDGTYNYLNSTGRSDRSS